MAVTYVAGVVWYSILYHIFSHLYCNKKVEEIYFSSTLLFLWLLSANSHVLIKSKQIAVVGMYRLFVSGRS